MSIDPNTIIPEDINESYEGIQQIKDYIPTDTDTLDQVRDKLRKLSAFLYKYLEMQNAEPPILPPK